MLILIVLLVVIRVDISLCVSSSSPSSASASGEFAPGMLSDLSAALALESLVADTKMSLRGQELGVVVNPAPMTASRAARNLLMSIVLLIGVVIAATLTVRDAAMAAESKPSRQCPLQPFVNRATPSKSSGAPNDDCLQDAPVDWDKILMSSKFTCVFDPSRLSIDNLLALPPPTFKSKTDFASAANYISFLNPLSNTSKQYVSLAE